MYGGVKVVVGILATMVNESSMNKIEKLVLVFYFEFYNGIKSKIKFLIE